MRKFAEAWPDRDIVQRVAAQIPWRNNQALFFGPLLHQEQNPLLCFFLPILYLLFLGNNVV